MNIMTERNDSCVDTLPSRAFKYTVFATIFSNSIYLLFWDNGDQQGSISTLIESTNSLLKSQGVVKKSNNMANIQKMRESCDLIGQNRFLSTKSMKAKERETTPVQLIIDNIDVCQHVLKSSK